MIWWILFLVIIVTSAYGALRGAPYVPTWKKDVSRFMNLAQIKSGQKVYDLGCGDGRLVLAAAQYGATGIGYEVSFVAYVIAHIRKLLAREKNVHILFRDFWFEDVSDADVVYVFLMEKIYTKLKAKLEKELKSGATVILYVWPMPGWEPVRVDEAPGQPTLYVYEMK